jgi:regulator of sigma E protease
MLVLLQNIIFTILPWLFVLTVVVVVHELGHFLMAKAFGTAIDRFSIGFGKTLLSWRDRSGVEWRLAALPLGGYVRFAGDGDATSSVPDADHLADLKARVTTKLGPDAVKQFFHFKPLWQRALVVAAGPFANFVLAVAIFATLSMTLGEEVVKPKIAQVLSGSAAERAGFKAGDVITRLDGRPVDNFLTVSRFAAYHIGRPATFVVDRGGQSVTLTAAPEAKTRPDPMFGRPMKLGVLGLAPTRDPADYARRRLDPLSAIGGGVRETGEILEVTFRYVGRMVVGRESGDQLGGPIRTALMSKAVAESGASYGHTVSEKAEGVLISLVGFAALISVGIGFMNLLPIPMLDGGHLLFYGYEAVARRPVTAKVQAVSYRVGLALVVGLMLFATWNDLQLPVLKILGGHVS